MKINQSFLIAILTFAPLAAAAEHYVAPNGSANGTGTKDNPWSLTRALGHPSTVQPGDTIWLRGGTYGTGGGTLFDSNLTGTSSQPVILRQYPGERAIINGGLEVNGAWTWFWGFEITNTYAQRTTNQESRQGGMQMYTRGHKAINLIIHDSGHPGIGFWSPVGDGGEIHGCIIWGSGIYDNSWSPTTKRGSAIYAQNQSGTRYITDVIAFRNWTDGIDIYTENAYADGFHIEGNIIFDHPEDGNIFASGGSNPARRLKIVNNYTYLRPNSGAPSIRLGYGGQYDATVQNNYVGAGDGLAVYSYRWPTFTGSGNTLIGKDVLFGLMRISGGSYSWNNNSYFSPADSVFSLDDRDEYTAAGWKSATGLDASSTFSKLTPPNKIVVRPNKYEAGRAHIAVFNWSKSGAVTVSLSGVLNAGDEFEIRDAQNFFGAPVASGTYNGNTVIIPMTGTQVAPILGGSNHFETTHTGPEFGAFVVLPKGAGSSTPPPLEVNAGPDQTVSYPGTVTLAGTADGSGSYTSQWSKVSGPGTTSFANASSPSTTVTFSAAGAYVLRLTVTQGSTSVNDTVSINASGDTTAPVISAVAAGSLTQTSAAIAWTTNEASDTQVEYGKTTSLGSATPLSSAKTLAHTASLTGLDVGVRYYFRVKSRDAAGNLATSATSSFTTLSDSGAPVISGVVSSNITNGGATISWTTSEASDTQVDYGTTTSLGSSSPLATAKVTSHTVNLSGLAAGTRYYFRVKSRDTAGNLGQSTTYDFTTTGGSSGGSSGAPTISQLTVDVTSNSATISWKTNEASDSVVYYGLTNALGQSASASGMATSHSVTLTGLAGNTRYYYRVSSADAGGARATYYTKYLTTDAGSGGGGGSPAGPNELSFEAEAAQLTAPMAALPNGAASGGGYISAASTAGAATFTVNVPTSGTYYLWARVYAPTASTDSFFVSVDGTEDVFDVAEDTWSPSWQWTVLNGRANGNPLTLNPRVLTLSAGNHQIVFRTREANTGLDRIILTRDAGFQPAN